MIQPPKSAAEKPPQNPPGHRPDAETLTSADVLAAAAGCTDGWTGPRRKVLRRRQMLRDARRRKRRLGKAAVRAEQNRVRRVIARAVRPRTLDDCVFNPDRPPWCPWVGCRYHLFLDVLPSGSILFNFPGLEPWQLPESCALIVAMQGGTLLRHIAKLTNLCYRPSPMRRSGRSAVTCVEVPGLV